MSKLENIFRLFLFMVFSAIGICAVAMAVLGPGWGNLYQMNAAVKQTERNNQKIEEIIKDHQILTAQINSDANILRKIASITLGVEPCEPNQPVVKITADTLSRTKAIFEQQSQENSDDSQVPKWLQRCTTAENRIILFSAGAGLVVVSFACFGNRRDKKSKTAKHKTE
jgi:hypothetical protein